MSKQIRLTATNVGGDLTTVDIYQVSASVEYLLTSSVDASKLTSPGFDLIVSESTDLIIVKSSDGPCTNQTSSISLSHPQTKRYFDVYAIGNGTVQINAPTVDGPTSGSSPLQQTVDFAVYSTFVIEATAQYYPGGSFDGWYNGVSGSGAGLISTENPLTITQTTFTGSDEFYAYFS
jgi:hypothetical protein